MNLQHFVTENKEENFGNLHFPRIMSIVFTSFKHPKLLISNSNFCTILLIHLYLNDSYIYKLSS